MAWRQMHSNNRNLNDLILAKLSATKTKHYITSTTTQILFLTTFWRLFSVKSWAKISPKIVNVWSISIRWSNTFLHARYAQKTLQVINEGQYCVMCESENQWTPVNKYFGWVKVDIELHKAVIVTKEILVCRKSLFLLHFLYSICWGLSLLLGSNLIIHEEIWWLAVAFS